MDTTQLGRYPVRSCRVPPSTTWQLNAYFSDAKRRYHTYTQPESEHVHLHHTHHHPDYLSKRSNDGPPGYHVLTSTLASTKPFRIKQTFLTQKIYILSFHVRINPRWAKKKTHTHAPALLTHRIVSLINYTLSSDGNYHNTFKYSSL